MRVYIMRALNKSPAIHQLYLKVGLPHSVQSLLANSVQGIETRPMNIRPTCIHRDVQLVCRIRCSMLCFNMYT